MKPFTLVLTLSAFVLVSAACSKQEVAASPKFDAKTIAAEADKGNLAPLTELNDACSAEVEKNGQRLAVCKVQDDVRDLRKPISIRF
ncbi:hypothetical protein QTI66_32045 [Variovorax sp. J22R133]|uniref:hypothetical protein n=1 Tax=Variovorax brevis TaxID=3053503 RepID=UPI0025766F6A|nr:hypothetical protein [Variovorax sp. J22R133]MDM0116769.1 hypothetical protein [Variovorax sp. J22R133]